MRTSRDGTSAPGPADGRAPRARRPHHGSEPRQVQSISALPPSPAVDRARRLRGYLISMGIRTVAFAVAGLAVVVGWPSWIAWVCIVAAVLLPYPAVVFANNVDRHVAPAPPVLGVHRSLGPAGQAPQPEDDPWRG